MAAELDALLSSPQPAIEPVLRPLPSRHADLNTAIEASNADDLLEELARLRRLHGTEIMFTEAVDLAIQKANLQMLRLLIDNGIPVDDRTLELAAECGHIPILKYLMQHMGWHINRLSCHGYTVFQYASSCSNLRLKTLLTYTSYSLATKHYDTVAWLLQQGANVNQEGPRGETPLSHAIEKGPLSVVTLLLDAGADVKQGTPLRSSLLRKAGEETVELMREMLARGAPVDKFFGESSKFAQSIGFERRAALHIACGSGSYRDYEAARLLLAHGANPALNQRRYAGELPNTSALEEARRRGDEDIVSLISFSPTCSNMNCCPHARL
jgi:hypothetical protein